MLPTVGNILFLLTLGPHSVSFETGSLHFPVSPTARQRQPAAICIMFGLLPGILCSSTSTSHCMISVSNWKSIFALNSFMPPALTLSCYVLHGAITPCQPLNPLNHFPVIKKAQLIQSVNVCSPARPSEGFITQQCYPLELQKCSTTQGHKDAGSGRYSFWDSTASTWEDGIPLYPHFQAYGCKALQTSNPSRNWVLIMLTLLNSGVLYPHSFIHSNVMCLIYIVYWAF